MKNAANNMFGKHLIIKNIDSKMKTRSNFIPIGITLLPVKNIFYYFLFLFVILFSCENNEKVDNKNEAESEGDRKFIPGD